MIYDWQGTGLAGSWQGFGRVSWGQQVGLWQGLKPGLNRAVNGA